ncbi:PldA [Desulforapulum autotrophicum HRM2]|uniref:Phosphatidylcholine 1-acylhydrolase n=2 Tax=Desulforapulum autotrophicum TaxID=2296 RepID=C0QL60_DESAH|nr:PldA [Desulforapulum autotrophicum HRM2]
MILMVRFRKAMFFLGAVVFLSCMLPAVSRAEVQDNLSQCAAIEDDLLRLQCYDGMANRGSASVEKAEPVNKLDTCVAPVAKPSYLSRLWELDRDQSRGEFAIRMHRSNYILPFSFNFSPNEDPIKDGFPGRKVQKSEATFQLSFKTKLWEDIGGKNNVDLWLGYTQRSFWQVYNVDQSSPFRETNYEPELLLNLPMELNVLGMTLRTINFGMNHQSNGRAESLSRSWNRIVANFGFERKGLFSTHDSLVVELKSWYRIPEDSESDDNPDIEDYLGYGEIRTSYFWKNYRYSMMVRNNLDDDENRGAIQLDWSFPLNNRISGYLQYYLGYGESLLDYNHSVNRVGLGFILTEWN